MKRKTKKSIVTNPASSTPVVKASNRPHHSLAKNQPVESVPLTPVKQTVFTLVFCLFFLLILVGVEVSMRMAGYGIDTRLFVKPRYMQEMYVDNVKATNKYFSKQSRNAETKLRDDYIRNYFPVQKPAGTLRGFFIGESSVQGYPYQSNHSFSKITEEALKAGGKYENVEIINLGVSAMTSYYIKDASLKALKYDPDFLLIYAGHNEYYGNVSYSTGGNRFSKNLYLAMKEFRFFQWLFDLLGLGNQGKSTGTLMEKQFNNHHIPSNGKVDRGVADDFVKNMDLIVKTYAAKKIPVIIVEPICNLYDMPPFAGENDGKYRAFIQKYYRVVREGDKASLAKFYQERQTQKAYDRNANIRYLDAVAQRILTGKPNLKAFAAAKDLDTVPFRVRSALVQRLKDYTVHTAKTIPGLYYIPLADELTRRYGEGIFSNEIFIDQLHFNQKGQRMLGQIFSAKIAEVFKFNQTARNKIRSFFNDDQQVSRAIGFLPAYQIAVDKQIASLTSAPPFTTMQIKYHPSSDPMFKPVAEIDRGLLKIVREMFNRNGNLTIQSGPIINYYLHFRDPQTAKAYMEADRYVYPGSYWTYLMAARFSLLEGNQAAVYENYKTAYLLSEKKLEIYDEMRESFYKMNQSYLLDKIVRKYGKPETETD